MCSCLHQKCLATPGWTNQHHALAPPNRRPIHQNRIFRRHGEHIHQFLLRLVHATDITELDVRRQEGLVCHRRGHKPFRRTLQVPQSKARLFTQCVSVWYALRARKQASTCFRLGLDACPVYKTCEISNTETVNTTTPTIQCALMQQCLVNLPTVRNFLSEQYLQNIRPLLQQWRPQSNLVLQRRGLPKSSVSCCIRGQRRTKRHSRTRATQGREQVQQKF
mmetsp:Transcript_90179/g.291502  ORF Transcript_90179/g.291502 Transcript_90179/m.291502 type:complete len:221 (+) Transcript_90179:972-1634(+)